MKTFLHKIALFLLFFIQVVGADAQIRTLTGDTISISAMDSFLTAQMDSLNMPGLSIAFINDGEIVYFKGLGYADLETKTKVTKNTVFEAASMSKPVFAYFVMKMIEKGVIDLDTPLYTYLPNEHVTYDERHKLFTARMVLSHTTGLPNWHEFQPPDSSMNVPEGKSYIMFKPGTEFSYSGEAYHYLVDVLAHELDTDQKGLDKIFYNKVSKPLDMEHAYFWWNEYIKEHRATGYRQNDSGVNVPGELKKFEEFGAAGGLRTNAEDFARFLIAIMNEKGLKKSSFDEMLSRQVPVPDGDDADHWGLGFAIKETPYGTRYMHSGNNGDFQGYFIMYKERKSGFVFLTNSDVSWELFHRLEPFFSEGKTLDS